VLSPDTILEEELLKTLAKQDNTIIQARGGITVFNRTLANALLIGKKTDLDPTGKDDTASKEKIV
jgi:hypothetical protein